MADALTTSTPDTPLTAQHAVFVARYVVHFDAQRAALEAGYSERGAKQRGHELLQRAAITRAIAARLAMLDSESELEVRAIIRELAIVGFSRVDHFALDDDGRLRVKAGVPPAVIGAVSSVEYTTTRTGDRKVKLRLWPKTPALDLLGQYKQLWSGEEAEVSIELGQIEYPVLQEATPPAPGGTTGIIRTATDAGAPAPNAAVAALRARVRVTRR